MSCSLIQLCREQYMEKAEIRNFSTSLQLDVSSMRAGIFHSLHAMYRGNIVRKHLLWGKKLKVTRSETKRNSHEKLAKETMHERIP